MTNEEKKEYPTYETTGGYTKQVEYKEAWSIFWRRTSEENRQKFLNLPNFDSEIFKEITRIDVEKKEEKKEEKINLDGKKYSVSTLKRAIEEYIKK